MSWLSDLFGGSSKKTQDLMGNVPKLKVYGFEDQPEFGTEYVNRIKNRMAGRDVGYDPASLDAISAPYAKAERSQFTDYSIPTISAQASSRGLGKSTIPVSQIRKSGQEVETSIGKNVAELTKANESQKRTEINKAIEDYYAYTKDDISYKNMQEQANLANYYAQVGMSQQADQIRSSMNNKIMQTVGGAVTGAISGSAGGPGGMLAGAVMGGVSSYAGYNENDIAGMIAKLRTPNASVVNTGYDFTKSPISGMTLRGA
jgi:hypothetical protein